MPTKATVIRVIIASPGDLPDERQIARDVIRDWNAIHADHSGIVLLPIGWESHSSPAMGDRAQSVLNKQILRDADLLIATFWTRLGSPTGNSESGTVEEIREHLKAGKPAMIYFSNAPVRPDSVDNEQFKALGKFKQECAGNGLVVTYDSLSEFHEKLARQLAMTIIRSFGYSNGKPDNEARPLRSKIPPLSDEAKKLLSATAAKDGHGSVMMLHTFGGLHVQAGNKALIENQDPKSQALWEDAVRDLVDKGYLRDRSGKGEVFSLTGEGYKAAEVLIEQR